MLPGLGVTSIPLNSDVPPSPGRTLMPAVSYKFIKLDQAESKDGSDPTPKFMLAGADANDPLLPPPPSKHLRNRKVSHICWAGISRMATCSTARAGAMPVSFSLKPPKHCVTFVLNLVSIEELA